MTSEKEKLLNDAYKKWIQAGLYDLPLDKINEFIDPKIMGYGTAIDEKILSISEYKQLINRQREQAVGIEIVPKITPVFRSVTNKEDAAIFVDEIKIQMIIDSEKHKLFLRLTTLLEYIDSNWIVVHWHGSIPTETKAEDDAWLVNEWKRKNAELEKLVSEKTIELNNKNRELEIETALEKVRSSALSMKQAGDMVDVCRIISAQLTLLGVKDIRNVQTAIINEKKGTYLNYQYFTPYQKSVIEETEYKKHPKVFEMVQEMKRSADAFFSGSMIDKELNIFREYRKIDGQFPDPLLDEATEVHYNFYSIGLGGLGLTTYKPLPESALKIFKRFHNVFTLAYRRFIDIEKAEAQAREAQIEAALEKVRSRTMAMHKSDELADTAAHLFEQLSELGIQPYRCNIGIVDAENDKCQLWTTTNKGDVIPLGTFIPLTETLLFINIYEAWKSKLPHTVVKLVGKDRLEMIKYFIQFIPYGEFKSSEITLEKISQKKSIFNNFMFKQGFIAIHTNEEVSEEDLTVIQRFTRVFEQTYTRFLDLQKAEAQAREAQIEAALERVRSRTMAMHKSEELSDVIRVVSDQFQNLKIRFSHVSFVLNSNVEDYHFWTSLFGKPHPFELKVPYLDNSIANRTREARSRGLQFYQDTITPEENREWLEHAFKYNTIDSLTPVEKAFALRNGFSRSIAIMPNIMLALGNYASMPYSEYDNHIIKRFAAAFEQSYTRFLDLQKAEAQAREAQIETALEKVRSCSLAMHNSDEMQQVANAVYEQLNHLGLIMDVVGMSGVIETQKDYDVWVGGAPFSKALRIPFNEDTKVQRDYNEIIEKREELFAKTYSGDVKREYIMNLLSHGDFPEDLKKLMLESEAFSTSISFTKHSGIQIVRYSAQHYSNQENEILKRFAKVFEQAYVRFMDLQKAEAQNKIIQAENERKTLELEEARQLQLSMLPKELPQISNLDIAVYMQTATEVGGDYYDFIVDDDGSLTVAIGDATGHGMKAGTIVSMIKALFVSGGSRMNMKTFFNQSSDTLKGIELGRLMMAFFMLKIKSNKIEFANAGMPPLFIYRKQSKVVEEIMINGMPLGAMRNFPYDIKELELFTGDSILLLSDGLPELKNKKNEQYDYVRVKEAFKLAADKSPKDIVEYLKYSASQWSDGIEPDDDVTFVVIKAA